MNQTPITRRDFIAKSAAISAASTLAMPAIKTMAAQPDKPMRIGWVGAGSRGSDDIERCLRAVPQAKVVAVADVFQDRIDRGLNKIREAGFGDRLEVTEDTTYLGFDAYKKVIDMDEVDVVFLLTPPGFRPVQFKYAIDAGKHCFLEKPGAVDPVGIRSILESSAKADSQGLSIYAGMQQRFMPQYIEIIKRVKDGAIGDYSHVGAYWLGTMKNWHYEDRKPEYSDVEYQIRTWPFYTWLSGDCCVEQLCHNLDVNNWVMDGPPEICRGTGGRLLRNGPEYGNIYDHFGLDYDYPNFVKGTGMNAQMLGISSKVDNTITGSKGEAWVSRGGGNIKGENPYKYEGELDGETPMYQALYNSFATGEQYNMTPVLAEATMTAIMGRFAAYTGRAISWKWAMQGSKLDLSKEINEFGPLAVDPVSLPGITKLV